jgi:hypothetical protein
MQVMASSNSADYFDYFWCKTPIDYEPRFDAFQSNGHFSDKEVGQWVKITGELIASSDSVTIECQFRGDRDHSNVLTVDDLYLGCA